MNFIISRNPLFFFLNLLYKKIQTTHLLSTFSRFFFRHFKMKFPRKYYFIILSFYHFRFSIVIQKTFPFYLSKNTKAHTVLSYFFLSLTSFTSSSTTTLFISLTLICFFCCHAAKTHLLLLPICKSLAEIFSVSVTVFTSLDLTEPLYFVRYLHFLFRKFFSSLFLLFSLFWCLDQRTALILA